MGELLVQLGEIADSLPTLPPKSLAFPMADFASFGERIFRGRGTSSEFLDLLTKLERVQAQFASEGDGLVEVLRVLLEKEPVEDINVGDFFRKCQQVGNDHGLLIAKNAQGFGRHLNNLRRVIEVELLVRLVEKTGHAAHDASAWFRSGPLWRGLWRSFMGLLDLLLGNDSLPTEENFAQTTSPSSPNGDEGGVGDTDRAKVPEN